MKYWGTTAFYVVLVLATYLDLNFWWLLVSLGVDALVSYSYSRSEKTRKELEKIASLINDPVWRKKLAKTEYYLDYVDEFDLAIGMDDKKEAELLKKHYNLFNKLYASERLKFLGIENMPNDLAIRYSERHGDF